MSTNFAAVGRFVQASHPHSPGTDPSRLLKVARSRLTPTYTHCGIGGGALGVELDPHTVVYGAG